MGGPHAERVALASPARRIGAFGVDYVVIAAYMVALAVVSVALGATSAGRLASAFEDPFTGQLLSIALLTIPVACYFALCESSLHRATPGKRLLGVEVTTPGGARISRGRAFLRAVGKLAPWEAAHAGLRHLPGWPGPVDRFPPEALAALGAAWVLAGLYLATLVFDSAHRTPYDRLARTVVRRSPGP